MIRVIGKEIRGFSNGVGFARRSGAAHTARDSAMATFLLDSKVQFRSPTIFIVSIESLFYFLFWMARFFGFFTFCLSISTG